MTVLYILIAVLCAFIIVIISRAVLFNPKQEHTDSIDCDDFDRQSNIDCLSQLIKCKTVSYNDASLEDNAEFEKLVGLLPTLYPFVFKECTLTRFDGRALLFRWRGKNPDSPTVLMAHYDVVPVTEDKWDKSPFDAVIENGVMWGRGTLDTKVTFNGILFSANLLISNGFKPENDIYLAFSGGEEINGPGAVNIVNYFKENNIRPALVSDEGGAVVENVFPGVSKSCALIGIAEKGLMNIEYKAISQGGHASAPPVKTPVVSLANACSKINKKPMKAHITKPAAAMFDILGRYSSFGYKLIFANLWCFSGLLGYICKKSGGELNALLRTTVAFTMCNGGVGRNVLPTMATMVSNIRINPDDSVESVEAYIRKTINDSSVETSKLGVYDEPSPISGFDCEAWDRVKNAVACTWKGSLVSPYLMVQCSDSRHYRDICDRVYRFSAMDLTADERKTIHGNNERIRLETVGKATEFYIRLIKQC